jgi:hypothetical protein
VQGPNDPRAFMFGAAQISSFQLTPPGNGLSRSERSYFARLKIPTAPRAAAALPRVAVPRCARWSICCAAHCGIGGVAPRPLVPRKAARFVCGALNGS